MHTSAKHVKRKSTSKSEIDRKARVLLAFGLFSRSKTSSEDFARRKEEEIEFEERNKRNRRT